MPDRHLGMISRREVDRSAHDRLGVAMEAAGMAHVRRSTARWRSEDRAIFAWVVHDSKALDPAQGGALTLEFEHSHDGSWMKKLAGRARFGALLRPDEFEPFVVMQNRVIATLRRPTSEELSFVPESLRPRYLTYFDQVASIRQPEFWIRYTTLEHLTEWWTLVAPLLPKVLARARTLDCHHLYLGRELAWDQ
jgi:hypothetical protein